MSLITGSDVFSNTWKTVFTVISGNVIDPQTRTGSKWIFADYPVAEDGTSHYHSSGIGFPIITIEPFQTQTDNITMGLGKTYSEINSTITIHTSNKAQIDTISSDIWDALNSNRQDFMQSGLHHLTVEQGGVETVAFDRDNKIHMKNMGVGFKVMI